MTQKDTIGNKDLFAIEYSFFDDLHDTEIAMYVEGKNILAFERNGICRTTRWNLDELVNWLKNFVDNMADDPYPVNCEGEFAAQKDDNARDFDSEDDAVFDEYYEKLYEWGARHRWHMSSSGAVLADVFFQLVSDNVEVSWDNRCVEEDVIFQYETGGARIPKKEFVKVVDAFLKTYANHWYTV